MAEIIDIIPLSAVKNNEPHYVDTSGTCWFLYSFKYGLDGKEFVFKAWATGDEYAAKVLSVIKENGAVEGRLVSDDKEDWYI